ncbi:MAG: S-methyl-5-thioribose-1-phosphate isomerase [Granulosicoccus sp.]
MRVGDKHYRSIWHDEQDGTVSIIDQRWLPHRFDVVQLDSTEEFATAIRDMWVRGAPLIGATAAWGMAKAVARDSSMAALDATWEILYHTRPTAVNLRWALDRMREHLRPLAEGDRAKAARLLAIAIADEDVEINRQIGVNGLELVRAIAEKKSDNSPVNILTHCNAGWLATVDWGTATSPMYHAADAGLNIHVWVDETRPRNQGALTAWELGSHGVPHTYIVDNAGGHLMQHGQVDMVIVGTDRTTASGDVCNKIGTYLKALAAFDNNVPFYVALPSPTIDWTVTDGIKQIPIEERNGDEVRNQLGRLVSDGSMSELAIPPDKSPVGNPAFDVTPARLVTGLITERGVVEPSADALARLFPDLQSRNSA